MDLNFFIFMWLNAQYWGFIQYSDSFSSVIGKEERLKSSLNRIQPIFCHWSFFIPPENVKGRGFLTIGKA